MHQTFNINSGGGGDYSRTSQDYGSYANKSYQSAAPQSKSSYEDYYKYSTPAEPESSFGSTPLTKHESSYARPKYNHRTLQDSANTFNRIYNNNTSGISQQSGCSTGSTPPMDWGSSRIFSEASTSRRFSPPGGRYGPMSSSTSKTLPSHKLFDTGSEPLGTLSSSYPESVRSKFPPSRDEMRAQLAHSMASDTNAALPGLENTGGYYGVQRPMSAVRRAQEAMGGMNREVPETKETKSFQQQQKAAKAAWSYSRRDQGTSSWNSLGIPGHDPYMVASDSATIRRTKQELYRADLKRQIEQTRTRRAEEKRLEHEGDHPLGPSYNSLTPQNLPGKSRNPEASIQPSKFEGYNQPRTLKPVTPPIRPEPRVGSSDYPRLRQAQSLQNGSTDTWNSNWYSQPSESESSPYRNPSMTSFSKVQPSQNYSPPQGRQFCPPSTAMPPQYGTVAAQYPVYPQIGYQQPVHPGFPVTPMGYSFPIPPPTVIQPPVSMYSMQPPMTPQYFGSPQLAQTQQQNYFQQQADQSRGLTMGEINDFHTRLSQKQSRPLLGSSSATNESGNDTHHPDSNESPCPWKSNDEDSGDDTNSRLQTWQTSDQVPDQDKRNSNYKAQLRKQIEQKRLEQEQIRYQELLEDQKLEKKIQEYNEKMRLELEKERQEARPEMRIPIPPPGSATLIDFNSVADLPPAEPVPETPSPDDGKSRQQFLRKGSGRQVSGPSGDWNWKSVEPQSIPIHKTMSTTTFDIPYGQGLLSRTEFEEEGSGSGSVDFLSKIKACLVTEGQRMEESLKSQQDEQQSTNHKSKGR